MIKQYCQHEADNSLAINSVVCSHSSTTDETLCKERTCLGVVRDTGRCAVDGWTGGGVDGRNGRLASFCKVAAVSIKPDNADFNTKLSNEKSAAYPSSLTCTMYDIKYS